MHSRGAHEINQRVREHDRRQMLLLAELHHDQGHRKKPPVHRLRGQVASVLRALAVYLAPGEQPALQPGAQQPAAGR